MSAGLARRSRNFRRAFRAGSTVSRSTSPGAMRAHRRRGRRETRQGRYPGQQCGHQRARRRRQNQHRGLGANLRCESDRRVSSDSRRTALDAQATLGRIVNVSSIAAWSMLGGSDAPYAAAKAGLLALTRAVAPKRDPRDPLQRRRAGNRADEMGREKHAGSLAAGRAHAAAPARHPKDIAATIAFLASDDASYITGEAITVSGGLYMHP